MSNSNFDVFIDKELLQSLSPKDENTLNTPNYIKLDNPPVKKRDEATSFLQADNVFFHENSEGEHEDKPAMNLAEFQSEAELYGVKVRLNEGGYISLAGGRQAIRNRLSRILELNEELKSEIYEHLSLNNARTVYRIMYCYEQRWPETLIVYERVTGRRKEGEFCCGHSDGPDVSDCCCYRYLNGYEMFNMLSLFKADEFLPRLEDSNLLRILNDLASEGNIYHETVKARERCTYELYSCMPIAQNQLEYYSHKSSERG